MWKRLTHPNILPLLGVTITPPQLVSNWMPGGDLQEYIKKNADANRLGLVCIPSVCPSHTHPVPSYLTSPEGSLTFIPAT